MCESVVASGLHIHVYCDCLGALVLSLLQKIGGCVVISVGFVILITSTCIFCIFREKTNESVVTSD